ncbi:class I SAM-dependent DNA methyltransferase [Streptomyces sp. NPDC021020]|uniref:class I SAM-dependent DNA methyltransferase n=1 Tax=Streptomyces sp. NPDC021020 TaxID=3365109 RepID=UPI0037BAACBF
MTSTTGTPGSPETSGEPREPYETAARTFYDTVAADYDARFGDGAAALPMERAILGVFAEQVREDGGGPVLEAGSGPGRVTAYLRGVGLDVRGVDLSPVMVALARREHPGLRFDVGSLTRLDVPDGGLAGLLAWYSLIHLPPEHVPGALAEFHRALAPGGHLLLGFQAGEGVKRHEQAFGHDVALDFHRMSPEGTAAALEAAGFDVTVKVVRAPVGDEPVPQAYVLARRRAGGHAGG